VFVYKRDSTPIGDAFPDVTEPWPDA